MINMIVKHKWYNLKWGKCFQKIWNETLLGLYTHQGGENKGQQLMKILKKNANPLPGLLVSYYLQQITYYY